ncbi:MAG TPA: carbamoyltransferase HypF [Giesbergeria sp.]|nr:carbamoyltransferase HypF [Giesbergeria sp.]HNM40346.1 carbamoyltransferase HypF [Giesbergeria sp.]HNN89799.1 carbamoyltransferase HypF [Giesbergeria sp.]
MARILACGAFLKNSACLFDTQTPQAPLWSAVHGDLSDPAACAALEQSVLDLLARPGAPLDAVAHDLHPDFFSTRLALRVAGERGLPAVAVQHHHAHAAAVLAEHGVHGPVIALTLDGVGLGLDGTAWGGELLWVHGARCERVGHLGALALPGGDVAAREPWRMAAALLHASGQAEQIVPRFAPVVGDTAARTVQAMLARGLNCPQTTAAGRWFDAVAGLLGLSVRQDMEAQAAIALEQAAARHLQACGGALAQCTDPALAPVDAAGCIDLRPLCRPWAQWSSPSPAQIDAAAAQFHLALADALVARAAQVARAREVRSVVLGGGCFFNRILAERCTAGLQAQGLWVHTAQALSCGDAGLALGQAWVAAQQLAQAPQSMDSEETAACA